MIKTCNNCANRHGPFAQGGVCISSGYYCTEQRRIPDKRCDENFSGWVERPKYWFQKLWEEFTTDHHPNALSLSEQIASIQDQVNRLKELLEEQEQEQGQKEQTFRITFEYKTNANVWPIGKVDEDLVQEQILEKLEGVTSELQFDEEGEKFKLVTVSEVTTAP